MIDKSSIISLKKETWELKSLGEIATEISTGKAIKKEQLGAGDYPVIYWAEILGAKECAQIKECLNKVNLSEIKNPNYCQYGDLLIAASCKRVETLGKGVVYLGNEKPVFSNDTFKIEHKENPKFLLHSLNSGFVKKQIRNFVEDTVIVHLKAKHLRQIKIPLPPKHIQEKVMNFLDQFSNLKERIEEELNEELKKRQKQYEYYKEAIFGSGINIWKIVTLDKVINRVVFGKEVFQRQLGTGNYPAIKCADVNSKFKHSFTECLCFLNIALIDQPKLCEYGDILMGASGDMKVMGKASVYLGNEKPVVGKDVWLIKHNQNGEFLSYILNSEFASNQIKSSTQGAIIMHLRKDDFQHIKIPLPSLEEQNKIVEVLDKLRISVETLQKEIPLLIKDLNKQYLYFQKQMLEP